MKSNITKMHGQQHIKICPKHVQLIGIINKLLLLHLVGCLYYLYQWCTVKQISNSPILYLFTQFLTTSSWNNTIQT